MKQVFALVIGIGLAIGALALILSFAPTPEIEQSQQKKVAATIFPLYDITKNIAGTTVDVELILEAGASPHTFDPSPATMRKLQGTQAVYAIGHGLDDWTFSIVENIEAQIVGVDRNIDLRQSVDHDHETDLSNPHDEEFANLDPHYWLSISNAKIIAKTIANDLTDRFPEHTDSYQENLNEYIKELDQANAQIQETIDQITNKQIITLHDAWYYFSNAYGLEVAGIFEPTAGREPSPQYLADLTEAVIASGSNTLYSEPQLSTLSIQAFSNDNDLTIVELDPIGGIENRQSYTDMMKYNAEIFFQNQ
jgi:zinc transport system substrate-binding protein